MIPDSRFAKQDKSFWASIRSLSQELGYTERGEDKVKVPTVREMYNGFIKLQLDPSAIADRKGQPTELAKLMQEYFEYRAKILFDIARPNLMTAADAKDIFNRTLTSFEKDPKCPLPMNKQKGNKKDRAFLTCIVNMLIEKHSGGADCDYDPRKLTTITKDGVPLRTLARRVDGAFPRSVNPVAIWEVKEYYYTTTFGSRVADGVYESLLDGLELEELRDSHDVDVKHYLIVDAYETWWVMGKAYLCRMIDMLHMGYVDEVMFGKEVFSRIPILVDEWMRLAGSNTHRGDADAAAPA